MESDGHNEAESLEWVEKKENRVVKEPETSKRFKDWRTG